MGSKFQDEKGPDLSALAAQTHLLFRRHMVMNGDKMSKPEREALWLLEAHVKVLADIIVKLQ